MYEYVTRVQVSMKARASDFTEMESNFEKPSVSFWKLNVGL